MYVPGGDRWDNTIGAKPVTHDHAVPFPFSSQYILNQMVMRRAKYTVDLVVGSHDAPRFAISHGNLEGLKVNLAQCAIGYLLINKEAPRLLVIGNVVLDASRNSGTLNGVDVSRRKLSSQVRVFTVGLEVATTQGRPWNANSIIT
jgi:hypothetical protein